MPDFEVRNEKIERGAVLHQQCQPRRHAYGHAGILAKGGRLAMRIIGVDPGPLESAYVIWDGARIEQMDNVENLALVTALRDWPRRTIPDFCVIEQIRGQGVPAGNALFDTTWWSGRFYQAWGACRIMLPRDVVVRHFGYGGAGSRDAAVTAALTERLGGKGTKKAPGVLYGVSGHLWAALAVAVCYWDRQQTAIAAGTLE